MILVVDDIAENRYLLETILKSAGYEVVSVRNGAEALASAHSSQPELIVADILMPVMDGFELCRRWKADAALKRTPFVFYTATYTDQKDESFALSLGAERFLVKPMKPEQLIRELREVMETFRRESLVRVPVKSDAEVLEQYHEVLSHKLQKKVSNLENEIAARRAVEEELEVSEVKYRMLFESSMDGILIFDGSGKILDANPFIEKLAGVRRDELAGRTIRDANIFSGECAIDAAVAELLTVDFVRYDDCSVRDRDGRLLDVELAGNAFVVNGKRFIQCSIRDISERKRAEVQARFDALHDRLTMLPNRALFIDRLAMAIARSKGSQDYLYAVLFIDIDRFKLVNDSLGHSLGDALIVEITQRFSPLLREADTLARWGGDEFAILLDGIGHPEDATRIAGRIQEELRLPFSLEGQDVYATASIGMTLSSPDYEAAEEVLRDADTALFRAKAQGRDRYSIFDESMHAHAVSQLTLENDMRRAVERGEFRLHFQPIVNLYDGAVTGFEALVRWEHPEKGLLPPGLFIPVAEETGLIVPLGRWVLRESCSQLRRWLDTGRANGPMEISVNVASRQLTESGFLREVESVLREFRLPPGCLKIEITETVLLEHEDVATAVVSGLRERGVQVCMDDFGTGYSSLSNLLRYHVDVLKIDRAFVAHIANGQDSPIVNTILSLARNLGIGVVAEGVETEAQRARLIELECEQAQGYLFARPLEADAAWQFATEHPLVDSSGEER